MGLNYFSIPKLQWLLRWSLGMDMQFHPTLYNGCNYLPMLGLTLIHVSKVAPGDIPGNPSECQSAWSMQPRDYIPGPIWSLDCFRGATKLIRQPCKLTYRGMDKMAAVFQTTFPGVLYTWKSLYFDWNFIEVLFEKLGLNDYHKTQTSTHVCIYTYEYQ